MKVSYRTHPVLKLIADKNLDCKIFTRESEEIKRRGMPEVWINNCEIFKRIKIITTPFWCAMIKSVGKIYNCDEVFTQEHRITGTYMMKNEVYKTMETYCCNFTIKDATMTGGVFFYFQDDILICYINMDNQSVYVTGAVETDEVTKANNRKWTKHEVLGEQVHNAIDFYLFTKYAEIETKTLPPHKVIKDVECKYVNDTKLKVNILDSKWFTTLVKSDGFNVRGHFRFQPYGEGMIKRKLIWINEFEKSGYTAPARKLTTENIEA